MGIEEAKAFMEAVGRDPELRDRIAGLRGRTALVDLVAIADGAGYVFTEAEYRAAVVDYARDALSDEAIEELARRLGKRD